MFLCGRNTEKDIYYSTDKCFDLEESFLRQKIKPSMYNALMKEQNMIQPVITKLFIDYVKSSL